MRWYCATCGAEHDELPLDWAYDAPQFWDGPRGENDRLGADFCIWTDDDDRECYFVRGVLELPVLETEETFAYGVWSSLSKASFDRLTDTWDDQETPSGGTYFGWLCNALPEFPDALGLPLDVVTRADLRPTLVLHDGDHPLVVAQRNGVTHQWVRSVAEQHLHA